MIQYNLPGAGCSPGKGPGDTSIFISLKEMKMQTNPIIPPEESEAVGESPDLRTHPEGCGRKSKTEPHTKDPHFAFFIRVKKWQIAVYRADARNAEFKIQNAKLRCFLRK